MKFAEEVLLGTKANKKAIYYNGRWLNYGELRKTSDFLSYILLNKGSSLGNNNIVIFIEKNLESVVAIYGILKSGCAYVPVDVRSPLEKVKYIVDVSQPKYILTDAANLEKVKLLNVNKNSCEVLILKIDESNNLIINDDLNIYDSNLVTSSVCKMHPERRTIDDTAYIIFTSGSSGKPKGVMISHKSLCCFLEEVENLKIYNRNTKYASLLPIHFDASISDVFSIFKGGGSLFLMKEFLFPNDITNFFHEHAITDTLMISSVVRMFSSNYSKIDKIKLSYLKTIWYGGEACGVENLKKIKCHIPQISFVHGYGPTEATHSTTLLLFNSIDDKYTDYMPLGRTLSSFVSYAVDEKGKIINEGEIGELYIGGPQLMKGYINDVERTNKTFVKDITGKCDLIYKTGDLVTIDSDGNYVYKGRIDDLIKVKGFLVSTCEIEQVLINNPKIKEAFVIPENDKMFTNKLNAYVISDGINETEIRDYLASKLNSYMIPDNIFFVDEVLVPRTSNDKIDKKKIVELYKNL